MTFLFKSPNKTNASHCTGTDGARDKERGGTYKLNHCVATKCHLFVEFTALTHNNPQNSYSNKEQ